MCVARVAPSLPNLRESIASFTALPSAFGVSVILQFSIELFDLFYKKSQSFPSGKLKRVLHKLSRQTDCFLVPGWSCDPMYLQMMHCARNPHIQCVGRYNVDMGTRQSVHKVARQKGVSSGRTYTSKYRGVHQTFPTRRWEAQFRRNGKPTSLGCFDYEDEAARAYDRMMVWCELHGQDSRGGKVGAHRSHIAQLSLNFDYNDYEGDLIALRHVSQDDLVQSLRRQGRMQASNNTGGSFSGASTHKKLP